MSRLVYSPEVTMLHQSNLIEGEDSLIALADAMRAWDYLATERRMTHDTLKRLHFMLMDSQGLHSALMPSYVGEYRTRPVWVGGRPAVNAVTIRPLLDQLFEKMNERRHLPVSDEARAGYAQQIHVEYERVHPFMDGNGRTGRMLYNWHRLSLGLDIHIINSDAASRREYYDWFK